ncbi:MAG: hypothetical protein B7Y89_01285 [Novosphingobium sp. 32-60-15]|nr:MAG: hypothetical protein B7Y89_01285 [Novosphingobium sp. 32-60-15]
MLICGVFLAATLNPHSGYSAPDEMSQRPSPPKPGTRAPDSCGSQVISRFVGADAEPAVRKAVATAVGHERIRWIKPGTVITQDFQENRLNVILDQTGQILTMRCG